MNEMNEHPQEEKLSFTQDEIEGVERIWGKKWEDLNKLSKISLGIAYRYVLSPQAIADRIMGPDPENK